MALAQPDGRFRAASQISRPLKSCLLSHSPQLQQAAAAVLAALVRASPPAVAQQLIHEDACEYLFEALRVCSGQQQRAAARRGAAGGCPESGWGLLAPGALPDAPVERSHRRWLCGTYPHPQAPIHKL
jgi:hypothetical protein